MSDTELPTRVEKAAKMDASFSTPSRGPEVSDHNQGNVVVHKTDATYTINPPKGVCSCADHQYRGTVCKHQLAYGIHEDSETVIKALRQRSTYWAGMVENLRQADHESREYARQYLAWDQVREDIKEYKERIGRINETIKYLEEHAE